MSSPYIAPDAGTAVLFTPHTGVAAYDVADSDLGAAVNALYFSDSSRWPARAGVDENGDGGTLVLLPTHMVDSPDAHAVANWYAVRKHPSWFPGILAPALPTYLTGSHTERFGTSAISEQAGTVPYVNPANTTNPDAIYALNWILDHNP